MLRSLAAISCRKTLPLSVITPSIWPRGARLIGRYGCTCALIKWESARFHEVGNGIALGLIWGSCPTLYSPLLFSFSHSPWSFLPHENAVTPYSGWCEIPRRHWFAWVERFIVYAPIKHSIWLHPLTHRELTSTRIRLSLSLSLSLSLFSLSHSSLSLFRLIYINKIKFPCVGSLSLTASRENDSTDFQPA